MNKLKRWLSDTWFHLRIIYFSKQQSKKKLETSDNTMFQYLVNAVMKQNKYIAEDDMVRIINDMSIYFQKLEFDNKYNNEFDRELLKLLKQFTKIKEDNDL